MNSGQACVAGTRILVPQSRKAEIETALADAVAAVKSGDPRDNATEIGPMVSEKQWQRVQSYIRKGIDEGHACWRAVKVARKVRRTAGLCARRCLRT